MKETAGASYILQQLLVTVFFKLKFNLSKSCKISGSGNQLQVETEILSSSILCINCCQWQTFVR